MTDVKNTRLYKTLKKAVRKEDHAELLRMLEMVPEISCRKGVHIRGMDCGNLYRAFWWDETPQDHDYWSDLSARIQRAGHDCW